MVVIKMLFYFRQRFGAFGAVRQNHFGADSINVALTPVRSWFLFAFLCFITNFIRFVIDFV